jgi:hypothetical protein
MLCLTFRWRLGVTDGEESVKLGGEAAKYCLHTLLVDLCVGKAGPDARVPQIKNKGGIESLGSILGAHSFVLQPYAPPDSAECIRQRSLSRWRATALYNHPFLMANTTASCRNVLFFYDGFQCTNNLK